MECCLVWASDNASALTVFHSPRADCLSAQSGYTDSSADLHSAIAGPGTDISIRSGFAFSSLVAVLTYRFKRFRAIAVETLFYLLGALLLFKVSQLALPPIQGEATILDLLRHYHDPLHFFSRVGEAVAVMGEGFTPFLLLLSLRACGISLCMKNIPRGLFICGPILANLVFWLPNPSPARHYLPMAPAIATGAAIVDLRWFPTLHVLRERRPWVVGILIGMVCVGSSLANDYLPWKLRQFESPFRSRFELEQLNQAASEIAPDLLGLPTLQSPLVVLCDSSFVVAEMRMLSPRVDFQFHSQPIKVALDQLDMFHGFPVLVDPHNLRISHSGIRPRFLLCVQQRAGCRYPTVTLWGSI